MNVIRGRICKLDSRIQIFFFKGKASAGNIYTVNTMFGVLVTIGKKLFEASEAATREFESFCKPKCFLSIVQYNFHLLTQGKLTISPPTADAKGQPSEECNCA